MEDALLGISSDYPLSSRLSYLFALVGVDVLSRELPRVADDCLCNVDFPEPFGPTKMMTAGMPCSSAVVLVMRL
jgi:hypothetical protein